MESAWIQIDGREGHALIIVYLWEDLKLSRSLSYIQSWGEHLLSNEIVSDIFPEGTFLD